MSAVRLVISQEQSWPSELLPLSLNGYSAVHETRFFPDKFTTCWSNIVLSRCFCWTLSKTILSTGYSTCNIISMYM